MMKKRSKNKKPKKEIWPYLRTNLGGAKEYSCEHGVGHGGIHGCDGCCSNLQIDKVTIKKKGL